MTWLISLSLILTGVHEKSADNKQKENNTKNTIVFKRAESNPAKGLTEAIIEGTNEKIYLHARVELTQADIATAQVQIDDAVQQPSIYLTFNEAGATKLEKLTKDWQGKLLAIVVKGKVLCAPKILAPLKSVVLITGKLTPQEARHIVEAILTKE